MPLAKDPVTHLRQLGITHTPWADNGSSVITEKGQQWNYLNAYLSTKSLRDIAFLVADGWRVYMSSRGAQIHTRISRP